MTTELSFTVPGNPVPFARAGANGKRRFTPPKQATFMTGVKHFAALAMNKAGADLFDGPVELSVEANYLWPKSMTAKKRALPGAAWKVSVPDWDNLGKLVSDALNGVVWTDDARVVSGHVWKKYGDRLETRVRVRRLDL